MGSINLIGATDFGVMDFFIDTNCIVACVRQFVLCKLLVLSCSGILRVVAA